MAVQIAVIACINSWLHGITQELFVSNDFKF